MGSKKHTDLLIEAAKNGNTVEVQRLVGVAKLDEEEATWALRAATQYGHVGCVKLLVPVSDPKFFSSWMLKIACANADSACIDVLFDVSDPHVALHHLKLDYPDEPKFWQYLEHKIAERQKEMLSNHIKSTVKNTCVRKI